MPQSPDFLRLADSSPYMQLLKYAVEKGMAAEEFTSGEAGEALEALRGCGVIDKWLDSFCEKRSEEFQTKWRIRPEAIMTYLDYDGIRRAERQSFKAICIAVASLLVAVVTLVLH